MSPRTVAAARVALILASASLTLTACLWVMWAIGKVVGM